MLTAVKNLQISAVRFVVYYCTYLFTSGLLYWKNQFTID